MTSTNKKGGILGKIGVLLALIVVIIIMTILTKGQFLKFRNIMNVFRQTPMVAMLGLGELCVILLGGIDLSVGANLALATCTAGVAYKAGVNNSVLLILICLAAGAIFGAINGTLLTKLHLPHPFIAMTTNAAQTTQTGLEPVTSAVTGRRDNQLRHWAKKWIFRDSNPGPIGYEPTALTN